MDFLSASIGEYPFDPLIWPVFLQIQFWVVENFVSTKQLFLWVCNITENPPCLEVELVLDSWLGILRQVDLS